MMDVYDGRFRQNGSCGYVLKPSIMREQISIFSANAREFIPGVPPQILHLKVIILKKKLFLFEFINSINYFFEKMNQGILILEYGIVMLFVIFKQYLSKKMSLIL